jgi:hypothetical protein
MKYSFLLHINDGYNIEFESGMSIDIPELYCEPEYDEISVAGSDPSKAASKHTQAEWYLPEQVGQMDF